MVASEPTGRRVVFVGDRGPAASPDVVSVVELATHLGGLGHDVVLLDRDLREPPRPRDGYLHAPLIASSDGLSPARALRLSLDQTFRKRVAVEILVTYGTMLLPTVAVTELSQVGCPWLHWPLTEEDTVSATATPSTILLESGPAVRTGGIYVGQGVGVVVGSDGTMPLERAVALAAELTGEFEVVWLSSTRTAVDEAAAIEATGTRVEVVQWDAFRSDIARRIVRGARAYVTATASVDVAALLAHDAGVPVYAPPMHRPAVGTCCQGFVASADRSRLASVDRWGMETRNAAASDHIRRRHSTKAVGAKLLAAADSGSVLSS